VEYSLQFHGYIRGTYVEFSLLYDTYLVYVIKEAHKFSFVNPNFHRLGWELFQLTFFSFF
jgi:hypothetical protein